MRTPRLRARRSIVGLAMVLCQPWVAIGCACDGDETRCVEGPSTVGADCDELGCCSGGLSCVDDAERCGDTRATGSDRCCVSEGAEGKACEGDADCAAGLVCEVESDYVNPCQRIFGDSRGSCCVTVGSLAHPCGKGSLCEAGLTCVSGQGDCWESGCSFCTYAGMEGVSCNADLTCEPGLLCIQDWRSCDAIHYAAQNCCVAEERAGGMDQICLNGGECDPGLHCVEVYENVCGSDIFGDPVPCCVPTGGEGQRCNADGSCEAGLACSTDLESCKVILGSTEFGEPCCVSTDD